MWNSFELFILAIVVSSALGFQWENNEINKEVNSIMKNNRESKAVFTNLAEMMMNRTNIFGKLKNKNNLQPNCTACLPGRGPNSICDIPTSPVIGPDPNTGVIGVLEFRDVLHCAPGGVYYGSECIHKCLRLCDPTLPAPTMCGDHLDQPQTFGLNACTLPAVSGSCAANLQIPGLGRK